MLFEMASNRIREKYDNVIHYTSWKLSGKYFRNTPLRIFSESFDLKTESWSNLSQYDSVLCDGLINWLENWVTRNIANFFKSTLLNNWVMVEFGSIWLCLSGPSWLVFLKMSQSDSTYMGLYWDKHDSIFESLWLGKNSQCRFTFKIHRSLKCTF